MILFNEKRIGGKTGKTKTAFSLPKRIHMIKKQGSVKIFYSLSIAALLAGTGIFLFFLGKTDLSPSYQRKSLSHSLETLCNDEYSLPVTVHMQGDTVWIETWIDALRTADDKSYQEDALIRMKIILKSLDRIVLSIDSPPKTYIICMKETRSLKYALIMGIIKDMIQFQYGYLPYAEYSRRRVDENHSGSPPHPFELTLENFLSKLIEREILQVFEQLHDYFEMKNFKMDYSLSKSEFTIDYTIRPLKKTTPLLVFNQIKNRVKETLINKYDLKEQYSVRFIDRFEQMEKIFSLTELGTE
ncbi:MAG: hypothetical protein JW774_04735 [Candidatus Aureabacteria bacterium]|nr:hypothetical protein [Candidatus Auribacterota bacterium]